MKIRVPIGFLVFLIVAILTLWTVQSFFLVARVHSLETRLGDIETVLEGYEQQTAAIRLCIRQTNPALPDRQADEITTAITASARSNGLDPLLLTSMARTESSFNPAAVSRVGARGLLQVRPATFREVHAGNIDNWQDNIEAGARYLRELLRRFGDLRLALAAYNCGPSRPADQILQISGGYADAVLSGWHKLQTAGGDNIDGMRPLYLASSRW